MTLSARWPGPPPEPGCYLRTPGPRARVTYQLLDLRRKDPRRNRLRYNWTFTVRRVAIDEIPPGAVVHLWLWDRRGRERTMA